MESSKRASPCISAPCMSCSESYLSAGINDLSISHVHEVVMPLPALLVEDLPPEVFFFL